MHRGLTSLTTVSDMQPMRLGACTIVLTALASVVSLPEKRKTALARDWQRKKGDVRLDSHREGDVSKDEEASLRTVGINVYISCALASWS